MKLPCVRSSTAYHPIQCLQGRRLPEYALLRSDPPAVTAKVEPSVEIATQRVFKPGDRRRKDSSTMEGREKQKSPPVRLAALFAAAWTDADFTLGPERRLAITTNDGSITAHMTVTKKRNKNGHRGPNERTTGKHKLRCNLESYEFLLRKMKSCKLNLRKEIYGTYYLFRRCPNKRIHYHKMRRNSTAKINYGHPIKSVSKSGPQV